MGKGKKRELKLLNAQLQGRLKLMYVHIVTTMYMNDVPAFYLNMIQKSSWSCNKNIYTFSYSEKKKYITPINM